MQAPTAKPDLPANSFDADALIAHIDKTCDGRRVVLLIDELNALTGEALDDKTANFLKKEFLDRAKRYLVFTSHMALDVDTTKVTDMATGLSSFMVSLSPRGLETVRQPHSFNVTELRRMGAGCSSLTAAQVVILGGIPSLIYSHSNRSALSPAARFVNQRIQVPVEKQAVVLRQFISDVLFGVLHPEHYRVFFRFASVPKQEQVWWPLIYIVCILQLFRALQHISFQDVLLDPFNYSSSRVGSGTDWEIVVQAALVFRSIDAMVNGTMGPFKIAERDVMPDLECCTIPGEITTHLQARDFIRAELNKATKATIIVFSLSYTFYPDYDGFVGYRTSSGTFRIFGHQERLSREYPNDATETWIERSYLIRGDAPKKHNQRRGWEYMSEKDIKDLLGFSLSTLYPKEWPNMPR
jgi:hypothetical protein